MLETAVCQFVFEGVTPNADLQMHRSSPLGYLRRACSPRKRGESGPFSNGYMIVYGGRKNCSSTIHIPERRACVRINRASSLWHCVRTSKNFGEEEQVDGFL